MVERAIKLRAELVRQGYEVIEVYPYATKVRLWGKPIPPKSKPQGLAFLREHLALLMPELIPYMSSFDHHLYDAALAAYTAYLYADGEMEATGDPGEGVIYIPKSPVA